MSLGSQIKSLLDDINSVNSEYALSSRSFATKLNISHVFLSQIILGKRIPNEKMLEKIGEVIEQQAKTVLKLGDNKQKLKNALNAREFLKKFVSETQTKEEIVDLLFKEYVLSPLNTVNLLRKIESSKLHDTKKNISQILESDWKQFIEKLLGENCPPISELLNPMSGKDNMESERLPEKVRDAFRRLSIDSRFDSLKKYFDFEDRFDDVTFLKKLFPLSYKE
jgi:transcriptional regulator with XRE-family HTH domain